MPLSKCQSIFPKSGSIPHKIVLFIQILNFIIAILNILVNSGLLYGLKKTGQLKRTSCKFIALVTLSDFFTGAVVQPLVAVVLTHSGSENCWLELSTQFIGWIFIEFSALMVCLVALDRYLHMKYPMKYQQLMTKKRALVFAILCALVAVALAIGSVIASNNDKALTFYVISIMVCLPAPSVASVLYLKAYRPVRTQVGTPASTVQASSSEQAAVNTQGRSNGETSSTGQATLYGQATTNTVPQANEQLSSNGQGQDVPIKRISSIGQAMLNGHGKANTPPQINEQLSSNRPNGQGQDLPIRRISSIGQAMLNGHGKANTPPQTNEHPSSNGLMISNSQEVPIGQISSRKKAPATFQHHSKFAKAAKRILILLIFAWSPYVIVSCAWYYDRYFHNGNHVSLDILLWFSYLIIYSNSLFNGVIFASQNSPIKRCFRNIFCRESRNNTTSVAVAQ